MGKKFKWSGSVSFKLPIEGANKEGTWEDHKVRENSLRGYEKQIKKISRNLNLMKEANWELEVEKDVRKTIKYEDGSLDIPTDDVLYNKTPLNNEDQREIQKQVTSSLSYLEKYVIIIDKLLERVSTEKEKQEDINKKAEEHLKEE